MRQAIAIVLAGAMGVGTAVAQMPPGAGPSQAALDDAVRLGTVATLAPLCGIREEDWAFDLRRATILEATRAERTDDPALAAAPGSDLVTGALSFAEAEALESFAEAPPAASCGSLPGNPDLVRADSMVSAFRARRTGS